MITHSDDLVTLYTSRKTNASNATSAKLVGNGEEFFLQVEHFFQQQDPALNHFRVGLRLFKRIALLVPRALGSCSVSAAVESCTILLFLFFGRGIFCSILMLLRLLPGRCLCILRSVRSRLFVFLLLFSLKLISLMLCFQQLGIDVI